MTGPHQAKPKRKLTPLSPTSRIRAEGGWRLAGDVLRNRDVERSLSLQSASWRLTGSKRLPMSSQGLTATPRRPVRLEAARGWAWSCGLWALLLGWTCSVNTPMPAEELPVPEYQVKAVWLLNFARFVHWPPTFVTSPH